MLGHSWITSSLGYIALVATWGQQALIEQSIPQNRQEWVTFILGNLGGLIGIFAKDYNRTGGTQPAA